MILFVLLNLSVIKLTLTVVTSNTVLSDFSLHSWIANSSAQCEWSLKPIKLTNLQFKSRYPSYRYQKGNSLIFNYLIFFWFCKKLSRYSIFCWQTIILSWRLRLMNYHGLVMTTLKVTFFRIRFVVIISIAYLLTTTFLALVSKSRFYLSSYYLLHPKQYSKCSIQLFILMMNGSILSKQFSPI